jgi:hypothetical protein
MPQNLSELVNGDERLALRLLHATRNTTILGDEACGVALDNAKIPSRIKQGLDVGERLLCRPL